MGCASSSSSTNGDTGEYFVKSGAGITNTGKRIEGSGATSYGSTVIDPKVHNVHEWIFKITSGGGEFLIGIDEASMKSLDQMFRFDLSHITNYFLCLNLATYRYKIIQKLHLQSSTNTSKLWLF